MDEAQTTQTGPAMTEAEMKTALSTIGLATSRGQDALADAEREFRAKTTASQYLTPEGHTGAVTEATRRLAAAEDTLIAEADAAERQVRDILRARPVSREPKLTDADMARAATLQPFVAEDCADASFPQLLALLRRAVADGDPAQLFLLRRAVRKRLQERKDPNFVSDEESEERTALSLELSAIDERLGDSKPDPIRTTAAARLEQIATVRLSAQKRRQAEVVPTTSDGRALVAWGDD